MADLHRSLRNVFGDPFETINSTNLAQVAINQAFHLAGEIHLRMRVNNTDGEGQLRAAYAVEKIIQLSGSIEGG